MTEQLPEPDVAIDQAEDVPADELVGEPVEPGYLGDPEEVPEETTLAVDDAAVAPSGEVE